MMNVSDPGRGAIRGSLRSLGLAAAAMLVLTAATGQHAQALSLINPDAAPAAKYASDGLTTEIRGGRGHYPRRYCRIVLTYYGPRKVCRYRPWHNHLGYR